MPDADEPIRDESGEEETSNSPGAPPDKDMSSRKSFIILGVVAGALIVIALVVWAIRAAAPPYTAEQMVDAQIECDAQRLGASMRGVEYDELGCLRDELPKLSDDELNRLDSLIEEQGGTPMN